jgi:glycerol kinase
VERHIGRLLERNSRAVRIEKSVDRHAWARDTSGSYIPRNNWNEQDPKTLWKTYARLTELEHFLNLLRCGNLHG